MTNVMTELEVLDAAMQVGWVKFAYYKADGTKRIAIGTRNKALIERVLGHSLKESKHRDDNPNAYFDLVRVDWRQFSASRFIGMIFERMTNEQAVIDALSTLYVCDEFDMGDVDDAYNHYTNLVATSFVNDCMEKISYAFDLNCDEDNDSDDEMIEKISSIVSIKVSKCVPTPYSSVKRPMEEHRENIAPKGERAELIAELMELRKRESEILTKLFS